VSIKKHSSLFVHCVSHGITSHSITISSIKTLSITAFSIKSLSITTFSVKTLRIVIKKNDTPPIETRYRLLYAECTYAEFHISIIMLGVVMLNVIMLSVVAPKKCFMKTDSQSLIL
jgi:hypothetical protein